MIQEATEGTADSYGETSKTWAAMEHGGCWAEVLTLWGNELWKAAQVDAEASVRVSMRARTDITTSTKVRFKYGTRVLYPINKIPDVKAREWVFLCSEEV